MGYPIAPLVIGVILGPMADENLRRALMVSQGSFMPVLPAAGFADPVYHHRLDGRQPVRMVPQNKELDLGATAARAKDRAMPGEEDEERLQ
jgi:hypothetical protein